MLLLDYVGWLLLAAGLIGALCAAGGAACLCRLLCDNPSASSQSPPITVLKPLHGDPPGLEKALASALLQDYGGPVQLVCGVHTSADPAVQVVHRLKRRFPNADIALVANGSLHGGNRKISNLMNMLPAAKHDILVIADADIVAPAQWLPSLVAALIERKAGAVSCFYTGTGDGLWSRFAAMGISYSFLPNAVFGTAAGLAHPFFGATMALRRSTLEAIGGLGAFRNCLADDYEIGRAVRRHGLPLAYQPLVVSHLCGENSLADLWNHELRWARTVRTVNPAGHWGSFITHGVPLALIGAACASFSPAALIVLGAVMLLRLCTKLAIDAITGGSSGPAWLLFFRDVVSAGLFLASVFGMDVRWRDDRLRIGKGGVVSQVSG